MNLAGFSTSNKVKNHCPKLTPVTNATFTDTLITTEKVRQHHKNLDTKKAPDPDNISPILLKRCAIHLAVPITMIYRLCIATKRWPVAWKRARIVPVHKKNSRAETKNYRPISLLSILGKGLESLLHEELSAYLNTHRLISTKQFGFRSGRSSSDLLLLQSASWNRSLKSGDDTYVIALDFEGAFDRVWHNGIVAKLESFGISGNILQLLKDYLQNRSLSVVVNGLTSQEFGVRASVPQGSVLGPLLWNIYLNDLLHLIPEVTAYADDCTISVTCKQNHHTPAITKINSILQFISSWTQRWQISPAPNKTQMMLITRRQAVPPSTPPPVLLDGKQLSLQDSISILGVEFDSCLSFTNHTKQVAKTAGWKLGCIRRVSHLLDGRAIAALYKAQVRSVMEYSPLTWSSCPPSYLGLLDSVQNRATRLIQMKTRDPRCYELQPLQHRRDVGGLCVMFKANTQRIEHLTDLRLPELPPAINATRERANNEEHMLEIPFGRKEFYLRSFLTRYARLWNTMVKNMDLHHSSTLHHFKSGVNQWLQTI